MSNSSQSILREATIKNGKSSVKKLIALVRLNPDYETIDLNYDYALGSSTVIVVNITVKNGKFRITKWLDVNGVSLDGNWDV